MSAVYSILARNKQAFELFDPRAAACLDHLGRSSPAAFRLKGKDPDGIPANLSPGDTVVLLGIGDGSNLRKLLDLPLVSVLVVECEGLACHAALCRHDFSDAVTAGRLRLFTLAAESPVSREIFLRECVSELVDSLHRSDSSLFFVSTATTAYQQNFSFYSSLRQSVEDGVRTATQFAQARSAEALYDVTVVSPCCAIFDDLARCFSRLGLRVQLLRVPDARGVWTAEELQAARLSLASNPSRLVVTRNRSLLETELPTEYPQPENLLPGHMAMWWWDIPNVATHIDLRHPRGNSRSLAFARDILPVLPQEAEWLPPGARMPFVEAGTQPEIHQDIPLSFVGQSRLRDLHDNLRHLGIVLKDLGAHSPALTKDLGQAQGYLNRYEYLSRHRLEIGEAIDSLSQAYPAHAYYLRYLLEMTVTGAFRIAAVEYLLKEGIDIAVFGDDDWLRVPGMTAKKLRGICPPDDLPVLYRRSRINLNLNFMQVSSTVNPKVLDIAATGSVALTDHRPELDLLYPDPAARPFSFRSLEQMVERIAALLPLDLSHHRQAVRRHTCEHHTLHHRALWLARHFGLLPVEN